MVNNMKQISTVRVQLIKYCAIGMITILKTYFIQGKPSEENQATHDRLYNLPYNCLRHYFICFWSLKP